MSAIYEMLEQQKPILSFINFEFKTLVSGVHLKVAHS